MLYKKIVEVEWLDAQSIADPIELEALKELKPLTTFSVGYLVVDKKDYIILVFTDFGNGVIKHAQLIPRNMIQNIDQIKITKVNKA